MTVSLPLVLALTMPALFAQDNSPIGIELLARGPVHEAFALPALNARPLPLVLKAPPAALNEAPPAERPDGDVAWIAGYWSWDEDRGDFIWVTGCWRIKPEGKEWVSGYWRRQGNVWQWVSGFWSGVGQGEQQRVVYYPEPPKLPSTLLANEPKDLEKFFTPEHFEWAGGHHNLKPGTWLSFKEDHVYIPGHFRWTPIGHVYTPGYWDRTLNKRGLAYAPVAVDPTFPATGAAFTPRYAIQDAFLIETLFVRQPGGLYYFGDYYGNRFRLLGFDNAFTASRRAYEPFIVYERWARRKTPRWFNDQILLAYAIDAGKVAPPSRTMSDSSLGLAGAVLASRGSQALGVDDNTRWLIYTQVQNGQLVDASQRAQVEGAGTQAAGQPRQLMLKVSTLPSAMTATVSEPLPVMRQGTTPVFQQLKLTSPRFTNPMQSPQKK